LDAANVLGMTSTLRGEYKERMRRAEASDFDPAGDKETECAAR
jgi:hypothetical protein